MEEVRMHALGPSFLDPHWLISTFGLVGILALVFAESGLLIGFFLPGDSLLFTAGLLVAGGTLLHQPLWLLCLLVSVAAVAGDQFGYAFGRVRSNIEFILVGIVLLSVVPIGFEIIRRRRSRRDVSSS
jgi:membrane protein DedA with SNARE-associated domain